MAVNETSEAQNDALAIVGVIFGAFGIMGVLMCCCSPILTIPISGFCGLVATGCGLLSKKHKSDNDYPGSQTLANTAVILGITSLLIALLSAVILVAGMLFYLLLIPMSSV